MALISRLRERALDELSIVTGELDAMDKPLETLKKRLTTLTVTAPVKGMIAVSHTHPLGAVVPAGASVVKVTPLGAGGIIQIRIASGDINRVRTGQSVSVQVKAAGFNRYGGIPGRLQEISPSAFSDDHGMAYYRGTVILDRFSVGQENLQTRLLPGMVVDADIKTGSRSVFATLID